MSRDEVGKGAKRIGRPREVERPMGAIDGRLLDEDGFVRPEFREHVAKLRERPEMSNIGELMHLATSRANPEGEG